MLPHYYRKQGEGRESLPRLWRWPSLRKKWTGKFVIIQSLEHRAFWRQNAAGYTDKPEEAGLYTFEDAWGRTRHCGPEKGIIFCEVPQIQL